MSIVLTGWTKGMPELHKTLANVEHTEHLLQRPRFDDPGWGVVGGFHTPRGAAFFEELLVDYGATARLDVATVDGDFAGFSSYFLGCQSSPVPCKMKCAVGGDDYEFADEPMCRPARFRKHIRGLKARRVMYLYNVATHPDFVGEGIGEALVRHALKAAQDLGLWICYAEALVHPCPCVPGIELLRKCGANDLILEGEREVRQLSEEEGPVGICWRHFVIPLQPCKMDEDTGILVFDG